MDIQLLKSEDIDKVKWNSCVHYANNGNIFGYRWFLDNVAKDWDALVEGDYESVFPLVWRKGNWGSPELYQPALMREMGIYSIHLLSAQRIQAFLDAIPKQYKRINITLSGQNTIPTDAPFAIEPLTNYQLYLNSPYDILKADYSAALHAKLQQAEELELLPKSGMKPEKLADFYKKHAPHSSTLDQDFHALQRIMYNALHRGWGFASSVTTPDDELLAVDFFLYSHGQVVSLMPCVSPKGREVGAQEYLIDMLLRTHAGRPLILDFNAPMNPSLPQSFGAHEARYFRLKRQIKQWGIF